MTFPQITKIKELTAQGWSVIGPITGLLGAGTLMKDSEGATWLVHPDGSVTKHDDAA
jgi:hypothetical protein